MRQIPKSYKIQTTPPHQAGIKDLPQQPKKWVKAEVKRLREDNLQIQDTNQKTANVTTDKGGGNLLELGSSHGFEPRFWAFALYAAPTGIDSDSIAVDVPANPCPASAASPLFC